MKRNFAIIFKVNNAEKMAREFDANCYIGNGLYKMWLGGNKNSTPETIINRANKVFSAHKGLYITEVVDVLEI